MTRILRLKKLSADADTNIGEYEIIDDGEGPEQHPPGPATTEERVRALEAFEAVERAAKTMASALEHLCSRIDRAIDHDRARSEIPAPKAVETTPAKDG